jgi:hypothetical protein
MVVAASVTVTVALSDAPVGAVAVMVTVPRFPVVLSLPSLETVATLVSELVHVTGTLGSDALFAESAAVKVCVAGATSDAVLGETAILMPLALADIAAGSVAA